MVTAIDLADVAERSLEVELAAIRAAVVARHERGAQAELGHEATARVACVEVPTEPEERERELVEIWQMVLRRERVGIHDNFFNVGGHSLLAVRVASRVSAALQTEMPLRTLINNPTLAGCAGQIDNLLWARGQTAGGDVAAGVEGSI